MEHGIDEKNSVHSPQIPLVTGEIERGGGGGGGVERYRGYIREIEKREQILSI